MTKQINTIRTQRDQKYIDTVSEFDSNPNSESNSYLTL